MLKNKQIIVTKDSVTFLAQETSKWKTKETGGILMGYTKDEKIYITEIIGPGKDAIHKSNSFTPDHDYHLQEIARIYALSSRETTYLGDWHTHPDCTAYLSNRDKKTILNISAYKPARLPNPIMIVISTNPHCMKAWILLKKGLLKRNIFRETTILMT